MSYYDFDDHFWSPRDVCCHGKTQVSPRPLTRYCLWWRISLGLASLGFFLSLTLLWNPQTSSTPQSLYQSQSPTFPRLPVDTAR